MTAALSMEGVTKRHGATVALDALDEEVAAGEVLAVLGPSGCGKSTLLRLVAGLDAPTRGRLRIGGEVVAEGARMVGPEARPVNMVFQDHALWPHMRVERIVGYGLQCAGVAAGERRRRVAELLRQLRLDGLGRRLPSQLSGGQAQRVAIARALATEPAVLCVDEPLSSLDVQLRIEMRTELAQLFARLETTVLYVTHDPLEACAVADRLLVLRDGRVEQRGTPAEVFTDPASAWVAALAGFTVALPARVRALQATTAVVDVGGATVEARLSSAAPRPAPGGQVQVRIHDDALVERAGTGGIPAVVERSIFEGRRWRLLVDVAGTRIGVLAVGPAVVGARIALGFEPQDAVVVPAAGDDELLALSADVA